MKKSIALLRAGFQSSSGTTPEFKAFFSTFKREFKKELQSIGATDIQIGKGHFFVSGFFTYKEQAYYLSIPDVRGNTRKMLYRTAKGYKDFTGGANQYVVIESGMASNMYLKRKN